MPKHILRKIRYSSGVLTRIFRPAETDKQCPCCGYKGSFDTFGHPPRYGSLCPGCSSLERHRLLMLANQSEAFFAGQDVLHFAPEAVVSRLIGAVARKYLTADVVPGLAGCVLNIERIEQPDESWDVAVCLHVLEHVDDRAALAELHRILRKNGRLVIMAPIIEGWEITYENPSISTDQSREKHFGQYDHVRYYGRDIRDRLKHAGFDVREYTASGADAVQYGLLRGEKVFICTKFA